MEWQAALDLVIERTTHERYRELCAEGHPDRTFWRGRMVAKAAEPWIVADPKTPVVIEPDGTRRLSSKEEMAQLRAEADERARVAGRNYPPLAEQAGNLWDSFKRIIKSGAGLTPETVVQERLTICAGCDLFDQRRRRCRKCGCMMDIKARLAAMKCPLPVPKWQAWEPPADQ